MSSCSQGRVLQCRAPCVRLRICGRAYTSPEAAAAMIASNFGLSSMRTTLEVWKFCMFDAALPLDQCRGSLRGRVGCRETVETPRR